jgi:hypothetical protein
MVAWMDRWVLHVALVNEIQRRDGWVKHNIRTGMTTGAGVGGSLILLLEDADRLFQWMVTDPQLEQQLTGPI